MTLGKNICFGIAILLFAALLARSQSNCTACNGVCQSPRNVKPRPFPGPYNGNPSHRPDSFITNIQGADTIVYEGQTLVRCDQHYHVPVENTQGCIGEKEGTPPQPGQTPREGQWVEIHTVYAPHLSSRPDCADALDHNLECCEGTPIVVRGFSARVADNPSAGPPIIQPPDLRPLAEWSGSNTGPGEACKTTRAFWSFLLTCDQTVNKNQLGVFPKAHGARGLQTGEDRISKDLTLVGTPPTKSKASKK